MQSNKKVRITRVTIFSVLGLLGLLPLHRTSEVNGHPSKAPQQTPVERSLSAPACTVNSSPNDTHAELDAFFPSPIDTSQMILPDCVRDLRDVLAENLHEVWSLNKIEAGWSFAETRDDQARRHPCLTTYDKLSQSEKEYDITLTLETLKCTERISFPELIDRPCALSNQLYAGGKVTLTALGYQISEQLNLTQQPKQLDLAEKFRQSNGYKPAPYDLSSIPLTRDTEDLVESLAANLHEIWAKNRIQQGWSYGNSEDNMCKRSPHLLPYDKIDWTIKKANRDAVVTIVKSLLAFGCDLHPPVGKPATRLAPPSHQRFPSTISSASSASSVTDEPISSPKRDGNT